MADTLLDEGSKALIAKAEEALDKAYAPYSSFQVAVALLLDNGEIITGSNQENAAYPLCMCAERVGLYAKASVRPDASISKIALVARKRSMDKLVPAAPCGSCRQVLLEFEARQKNPIEIIMQVETGKWVNLPSVSALLPYGFSGSNLL